MSKWLVRSGRTIYISRYICSNMCAWKNTDIECWSDIRSWPGPILWTLSRKGVRSSHLMRARILYTCFTTTILYIAYDQNNKYIGIYSQYINLYLRWVQNRLIRVGYGFQVHVLTSKTKQCEIAGCFTNTYNSIILSLPCANTTNGSESLSCNVCSAAPFPDTRQTLNNTFQTCVYRVSEQHSR